MAVGAYSARAGRVLTLAAGFSALLLGLGGCGSGGSKVAAIPVAATTRAVPAAAVALPAWSRGLGAGVTVVAPAAALEGHGSPGAAVQGEVNAMNRGKAVEMCPFMSPSLQAECRARLAGRPAADDQSFKGFALGYVAIDGDRALVGSTGAFCVPNQKPECLANSDPAAILSGGKPFAVLWAQALAGDNSATATGYALATCIKVGNSWYIYLPASSS
jgi:hypothetical protein